MSPTICICNRVTEDEIVGWIRRGFTTVDDIGEQCGAGQGCGGCRDELIELIEFIDDFADEAAAPSAQAVTDARS
ncbi:bacterioferritin-associated ferredoxin [Streptomyces sp. NBC_01408]|uniref:(2Fe-2S)-binding protein n=1 Tax=Streptomyces sp. NBC_01408 TaxID=2903855 RepID=UPI002252E023|nr:(2Fe-2S)-binding protein [Streptomyces sp. NBC_01408]MCX4692835.1 (2Fe-2S)-binding protein [Streptomyces sp. NBC_01408]